MDITVLIFASEAIAVAACIGWCARALTRQLSYRETCRTRLRGVAA